MITHLVRVDSSSTVTQKADVNVDDFTAFETGKKGKEAEQFVLVTGSLDGHIKSW